MIDMPEGSVVYLSMQSWGAVVNDAAQIYAFVEVMIGTKITKFPVSRPMTPAEVIAENKCMVHQGFHPMKQLGDRTQAFDTKDAAIASGVALWRDVFPDAEVLLLGNSAAYEPHRVLDADNKLLQENANAMLQAYDLMLEAEATDAVLVAYTRLWEQLFTIEEPIVDEPVAAPEEEDEYREVEWWKVACEGDWDY